MSRGRVTGMFTRVSLAGTSLVIVTIGYQKKQWSHYNDVTESQGVIHITVHILSVFIRHPFDRAFRPFSPLRFWSRGFRFFSCLGAIGTNFWISGNFKE